MYQDSEKFWYWDFGNGSRGNYLMWESGSGIGTAFDLSSVHLISSSDYNCEFNVIDITIGFKSNQIISSGTKHFFEDYETGGIYYESFDENGKKIGYTRMLDKSDRKIRIYNKLAGTALRRG